MKPRTSVILSALSALVVFVSPAHADSAGTDSYMELQQILSSATDPSDLERARDYFTGDALKAFDKVIRMADEGKLHDDPVKYLRMIFQTSSYPPNIEREAENESKTTIEITGTAPFQLYGTAAGAPVRGVVSMVNEDGRWKLSELKARNGTMPVWVWYGIELDK